VADCTTGVNLTFEEVGEVEGYQDGVFLRILSQIELIEDLYTENVQSTLVGWFTTHRPDCPVNSFETYGSPEFTVNDLTEDGEHIITHEKF